MKKARREQRLRENKATNHVTSISSKAASIREKKPKPPPVEKIKGQWSKEEDEELVRLVTQFGTRKWSSVSRALNGRVGKQCRERWNNHLRPDIRRGSWSTKEESKLIELHKVLGNKWADIAKGLPGTDGKCGEEPLERDVTKERRNAERIESVRDDANERERTNWTTEKSK